MMTTAAASVYAILGAAVVFTAVFGLPALIFAGTPTPLIGIGIGTLIGLLFGRVGPAGRWSRMIHKFDDGTVCISSHQVWIPGNYESERAGRYAFRFPDTDLQALQDRRNQQAGGTGGIITFDDLRGLRAQRKREASQ